MPVYILFPSCEIGSIFPVLGFTPNKKSFWFHRIWIESGAVLTGKFRCTYNSFFPRMYYGNPKIKTVPRIFQRQLKINISPVEGVVIVDYEL